MLSKLDDISWGDIAKVLEVDNIADAEELVSGNIGSGHLEDQYELMENTIIDAGYRRSRQRVAINFEAQVVGMKQATIPEIASAVNR